MQDLEIKKIVRYVGARGGWYNNREDAETSLHAEKLCDYLKNNRPGFSRSDERVIVDNYLEIVAFMDSRNVEKKPTKCTSNQILQTLRSMLSSRNHYAIRTPMIPNDINLLPDGGVDIHIWGGGIVLNEDGTWYFTDTSGG